jgi:hypothetical protein
MLAIEHHYLTQTTQRTARSKHVPLSEPLRNQSFGRQPLHGVLAGDPDLADGVVPDGLHVDDADGFSVSHAEGPGTDGKGCRMGCCRWVHRAALLSFALGLRWIALGLRWVALGVFLPSYSPSETSHQRAFPPRPLVCTRCRPRNMRKSSCSIRKPGGFSSLARMSRTFQLV